MMNDEYGTKNIFEMKYLRKNGFEYVFSYVDKKDGRVIWKFPKNKALFEALVKYWSN